MASKKPPQPAPSRTLGTFRGRRPIFFLSIHDWEAMSEDEQKAFVAAAKRKAAMLAHLTDEEPDPIIH